MKKNYLLKDLQNYSKSPESRNQSSKTTTKTIYVKKTTNKQKN